MKGADQASLESYIIAGKCRHYQEVGFMSGGKAVRSPCKSCINAMPEGRGISICESNFITLLFEFDTVGWYYITSFNFTYKLNNSKNSYLEVK
jgi:hypothetical protein